LYGYLQGRGEISRALKELEDARKKVVTGNVDKN